MYRYNLKEEFSCLLAFTLDRWFSFPNCFIRLSSGSVHMPICDVSGSRYLIEVVVHKKMNETEYNRWLLELHRNSYSYLK